jgi:hypothetical protein
MLRFALSLVLAAAAPLSADVTVRYKSDFKFNPSLPPAIAEQAMKNRPPTDSVIRVKGHKGLTEMLGLQNIVDTEKQMITVIDPTEKRFATVPVDAYMGAVTKAMPTLPPQAMQALSSMKAHSGSKATGRTETIRGVQAEEREVTVTVDAPDGAPFTGTMFKMAMQLWMAKPSEADRVPAVRELAALNLWNYGAMNPGAMMQKMLEQMPGMGDALKSLVEEFTKNKTMLLRTHVDIYMPMFAQLAKQMPAGASNPFGENFDGNAAFAQMTQQISELSTAPVPDSAFQVPADYKAAPLEDILKDMMARMQGGVTPQEH